ncbi:MAG: hypothetical protein V2A69_10610 [Pseudomonadota bacterium]
MSRFDFRRKFPDEKDWEGPRVATEDDYNELGVFSRGNVDLILDAMDWPQLLVFRYGDSDRVAAPFVVGISKEGNPLMRGYQLEGLSRSGKGEGWRVFQVLEMLELANHQDFFNPEDFDFDPAYPWIYKVFAML